jgi:dTDP-4-amino-4,6-dideoxygalactose transaminase
LIPYGRHSVDDSDVASVVAALKSDWLTIGPLVDAFELALEDVVGTPTVAVSSGTAALHCAYAAIELRPGDEIITPPITFVATQATARMLGADIKFADVLSDTANIDPRCVEKIITAKTRAIVAVDFAGHPADMHELRIIADRHKLFLIEDAAHSIGSTYRGKQVGTLADLTTFSFFPTKNMTTGEGGAVSSANSELLDRARKFSRQGLVRQVEEFKIKTEGSWHQEVHDFGLNYRLPDILCALGISQLKKLDEYKEKRKIVFQYYRDRLEDIPWIQMPACREYVDPNWHLFPVRVQPEIRRRFFDYMRTNGIGVQVNYLPAYRHPAFGFTFDSQQLFPNSEAFYQSEVSLPMHVSLSMEDLDRICALIEGFQLSL